jgi:hypothetical protein
MPETPTEKVLAAFSIKGAAIKKLENRRGTYEDPVNSDLMEREFRPFKRTGVRDPNSGAELVGSEEEFVEVARQARDDRLVGMASGQVVRAAGSLQDGSGMLYDLHGRPLVTGNAQQAPISRTKRSPKDW